MLYISYGVSKSASTYTYQLTEEILRAAGRIPLELTSEIKGREAAENFIDPLTWEDVERVLNHARGASVVIKTHSAPDARTLEAVSNGAIFASAVIRDPREIALSLVDHAQRSRRNNISDFAEFYAPLDTLKTIKDQMVRFKLWASSRSTLMLNYESVCFDTRSTIAKISSQVGAVVNSTEIISRFNDKSAIGQFNKGVKYRYLELSTQENDIFLSCFPDEFKDGIFTIGNEMVKPDPLV